MNRDEFQGKWKEFKGKVREKWGKLTNDDLEVINGRYDQFIGLLQQRYGYSKEKAEQELHGWKYENRGGEQNYGGKGSNQGNYGNQGGQHKGPQGHPPKRQEGNFGHSSEEPNQNKDKYDDRKDKKRKAG